MPITATDPRILGYLGRALSLEYTAVQQYMTQAGLCDAWGLPEAGDRFRHESVEEMQHAQRIIERMLLLGVAPNASKLEAVALASDLAGLLQRDAALEARIVALYDEATRYCRSVRDLDNAGFFESLLTEEVRHAGEIHAWISSHDGASENRRQQGIGQPAIRQRGAGHGFRF
jgi:bacterioferritin